MTFNLYNLLLLFWPVLLEHETAKHGMIWGGSELLGVSKLESLPMGNPSNKACSPHLYARGDSVSPRKYLTKEAIWTSRVFLQVTWLSP